MAACHCGSFDPTGPTDLLPSCSSNASDNYCSCHVNAIHETHSTKCGHKTDLPYCFAITPMPTLAPVLPINYLGPGANSERLQRVHSRKV
eukprot:624540-Amphidinium_carterae.1